MILDEKPIGELKEADLLRLVDEKVKELHVIEYKRQLPGGSDCERKEFLADVTSFANSRDGYLLYGIEETGGEPTAVCGVESPDPGVQIRRLESMVLSGVAPRLHVQTHPIEVQGGRVVFVMKIPKSWSGPHMVTYKDWSRFYSRTSAGKYLLKVDELRRVFLERDSVRDYIRKFRLERLAAIAADDTPHALRQGPKMVIHVVPYGALERGFGANATEILGTRDLALPPHATYTSDVSLNLDGMVAWWAQTAYVQVFRDGSVEAVTLLPEWDSSFYVDGVKKERELPAIVARYLEVAHRLSVEGPSAMMISYLGIRGCALKISFADFTDRIDRDQIVLPEIVYDGQSGDLTQSLRPAIDAVWNAFGKLQSYNYDKNTGLWRD